MLLAIDTTEHDLLEYRALRCSLSIASPPFEHFSCLHMQADGVPSGGSAGGVPLWSLYAMPGAVLLATCAGVFVIMRKRRALALSSKATSRTTSGERCLMSLDSAQSYPEEERSPSP